MKNAVENPSAFPDDEEGVAEAAASLGSDGGPVAAVNTDAAEFDSDLDDILDDDDSWLDEELSDEELAALGEEDFALGEEFDDDDFSGDIDVAEFDEGDDADDFSLDEDSDESAPALKNAVADDPYAEEPSGASSSETVAASASVVSTTMAVVEGDDVDNELTELDDSETDHRPVPRISIHAFCETQETTALLERAAVDRRLSKTHLTIHMGGIPKAVDQFQSASTPNLIILETVAGGKEIFELLGQLAEVCDPSTKVVIIGRVNDIILYRELIRQGISEYIVRPNSPLQIIKTIADLYVDPSAPPIGRTLAFVGARGGAGSSTIAHNIGWCTAEEHQSATVILDLDLPFGTASLDFDQEASAGLAEALSSPERLDDVLLERLLQKHTEHLSLFTAPSMLDRDFDLDDQAYETVIDIVRGVAPTIIVDVPHIWTNWSKRILTSADEIVVVATPDLASFRNTKNLIDILSAARPNDSSPTLVLNQFDPKVSPVQADQFVEHVGIEPAQIFGWEPQLFGAAATNAAPIIEVGPKTKTANGLRELAARLLGRNETFARKPKFSLSGLFKKKN
ncbi:MAG: hypothetical protein AAGB02_01920 [Pseudomonadota bacterium]